MGDILTDGEKQVVKDAPKSFVAYLLNTILSDSHTQMVIGTCIRWALHGAGVLLAAHPLGRLLNGAASNADWCMMAAGAVLSGAQLVWSIYQKWRTTQNLNAATDTADAAIAMASSTIRLPMVREIRPEVKP